MTALPTTLKKVLDEHLPFASTSARAIQRAIALHIGHTTRGGKIDPIALREQCEEANLFNYVPEGYEKNTFGANYTVNMKKDAAYFDGDKTGWTLTDDGKTEAKRIFDKGESPTKRRTSESAASSKPKASNAKPKAVKKEAKKASAKKAKVKAPAKKGTTAKKSKAKASTSKASSSKKATKPKAKATTADRVARKAAARRKKRELTQDTPAAADVAVEETASAAS